jgi:OFA family oxalate/formate antiporter-like MFS transporter
VNRWLQLFAGVVCMVMIANLQYGWTLFVQPINEKFGWGRPAIQVAFSIFVITEAWLVPLEGWFVDRFGPRLIVTIGGFLIGIAWVVNAFANSLPLLYLGAALGGIGVGCVYGTCVGNALKWFPDRRGLAAGITAAGFGVGSAFTIIPIQNIIRTSGYESAFLWFGLGQGLVILAVAPFLRTAPSKDVPDGVPAGAPQTPLLQTRRSHSPAETLRSPVFWLLYLMMALVSAGGLMATAQLAPIAHEFKVAGVPVSLLGITLPALTFALSIDRVLNGFTRPFFGWVSDHIGRENTMFIAFALEAAGILALGAYGHDPLLFVLLGGVVFFAWGEIYSLFPSICTDCYGTKYATTNAGLLYTAK